MSDRMPLAGYAGVLAAEEAARRDPGWQEAYRASLPPPPDRLERLREIARYFARLEGRPWLCCRDEAGLRIAVAWADATEEQRGQEGREEFMP